MTTDESTLSDVPLRDDRYERAAEFVDVVTALWDSAATGDDLHHHGDFFDLDGRLRVPPARAVPARV